MAAWKIRQTVDLAKPLQQNQINGNMPHMLEDDSFAHSWIITVLDGGAYAELGGYAVNGYFCRADGKVVIVPGEIDGNVCTVKLSPACYAVNGEMRGVVRLVNENIDRITLAVADFYVNTGTDNLVIDNSTPLPTYQELVAMVEENKTLFDEHVHGNISRDGAIGEDAGNILTTTTGGEIVASTPEEARSKIDVYSKTEMDDKLGNVNFAVDSTVTVDGTNAVSGAAVAAYVSEVMGGIVDFEGSTF